MKTIFAAVGIIVLGIAASLILIYYKLYGFVFTIGWISNMFWNIAVYKNRKS